MGLLLFLLMTSPILYIIGYLFFALPYGWYKSHEIKESIKNKNFMNKIEQTVQNGFKRIDKGNYICYKIKRKAKSLPIEFRFYRPNKWVMVFSTPMNEGIVEITYIDEKIVKVYADTMETEKKVKEYATLLQKRFSHVFRLFDEREKRFLEKEHGYEYEENFDYLSKEIEEITNEYHREREIHQRDIGRFSLLYTIDNGFIVLKVIYMDKEVYEATYDQKEKGNMNIESHLEKELPLNSSITFNEVIVPKIKAFVESVNFNVSKEQTVDWEDEITHTLSEEQNDELESEFNEIKALFHQMDGVHKKEAKTMYNKALKALYQKTKLTETLKEEGE